MYSDVSLLEVVKKQYIYKLKSYLGFYLGLMIAQIIAVLLSLNGVGQYSVGNGGINLTVNKYSADIVLFFTVMWVFAISIMLTTKQYKQKDFTLVTNRESSVLSDVGYLLTASILGGVTASVYGLLIRIIIYFADDSLGLLHRSFKPPLDLFLTGMIAAILYMLLISALGYLVGMLIQINKLFSLILPVLILPVFAMSSISMYGPEVKLILQFFTQEGSLILFTSKALLTSLVLFSISTAIYHRMEVRS